MSATVTASRVRLLRFGRLLVTTTLAGSAFVGVSSASATEATSRPFGVAEAYAGTTMGAPFGVAEPYSASSVIGPLTAPASAPATTSTTTSADLIKQLDPQIVIANPGTPTTAIEPKDITGVSQMVVDLQNGGGIGLCTATLINPRTVIFAAHCVNEDPATAYGKGSGGVAIGFGFSSDSRPGLRAWFLPTVAGGAANPNQFKTSIANAFYNASQVVYNPGSLEPDARSFLYSDVALATLDTPAAKIPTWALLFSALPATTISAAGSGYHVTIDGYGSNGTATTGSGGIDFRRRIAENMIGGLTNLETFEGFLFGAGNSQGLTQNLYFIDFDDPLRGLTGASPYDFNPFRDNAQPNEGTTAGGDSGGPLIVDRQFAKPVVAGVLSGGYTRFYRAAPANGYGTVSFYQPLYLYWDYIAANNPYHYVAAKAGDARWADATHWITTLDPNYQILDSTGKALVNGVPTMTGEGKAGQGGQFGQVCFQDRTSSDCLDVATGVESVTNKPIGTAANDAAKVSGGALKGDSLGGSELTAQAAATVATATPPATIANGLPGATNFVPNNVDPVRTTGAIGRYYDVTLGAAGTTTLDTIVTVDRFTMSNAAARLNITSSGSLTSLIDTTQIAGVTNVDGVLNSTGDYLVMGGGLTGAGRINAPFTTNVTGTIAPGTAGTVGTLTFGGNLILASGSALAIDLGANGQSDRIAVVTTVPAAGLFPANGAANLGGRIAFGQVAGTTVRAGNVYTILTAQGGLSGSFFAPTALSAILTPTLLYSTNAVSARIDAGRYADVVQQTPIQRAYAQLLDQNRGATGGFAGLYDSLDLSSAATIQSTLEGLAPRGEALKNAIGVAATDNISRLIRDHVAMTEPGSMGGQVAYIGRPMQTAALAASGMPGRSNLASDTTGGGMSVEEGRLPDTMSGFIAGGYLDGDSAPLPGAIPGGGRDQFNGYYIAGGLEGAVGDNSLIGLAVSYTNIDGNTAFGGQGAKGRMAAGTLYGKTVRGPLYADVQATAGWLALRTYRSPIVGANTYQLSSSDNTLAFNSEVGAGAMFGQAIQFGPRVAARASYIGYSLIAERGGGPALTIRRAPVRSIQGRAGLVLKSTGRFRPYASGTYVHDFRNTPAYFGANFVGGVGPNAIFGLPGNDRDWFEASAGLGIDVGRLSLSVGADTTISRSDVKNQSYRGAVKFHF